jgi:Tfp pilus assembly protein FimT
MNRNEGERKKARSHAGYSMVEALVVMSMLGLMGMVSFPLLNRSWHEYQMNRSCREVMANIQLAKLKSVSNNFGYSFRFSTAGSNSYQIQGSEPVGPDGAFHSWNDANGNGTRDNDQVYPTARPLSYGSFSSLGVSALPNGSYVGSVPATIVMTFQPDGRLDPSASATNYRCIVVQDSAAQTQAVCVENSGFVRLFKYTLNTWMEVK